MKRRGDCGCSHSKANERKATMAGKGKMKSSTKMMPGKSKLSAIKTAYNAKKSAFGR